MVRRECERVRISFTRSNFSESARIFDLCCNVHSFWQSLSVCVAQRWAQQPAEAGKLKMMITYREKQHQLTAQYE